jgi:amphi-Trp domain-containing protein
MAKRTKKGQFKRARKGKRDLEKHYPRARFIEKLRRLADAMENGERFRIQVAGERISIPPDAVFNIEHEREGKAEEVEFQLKWEA